MVAHTRLDAQVPGAQVGRAQVRDAHRPRLEVSGAAGDGFACASRGPRAGRPAWLERLRQGPGSLHLRQRSANAPAPVVAALLAALLLSPLPAAAGDTPAPAVPASETSAPTPSAASAEAGPSDDRDLITGSVTGTPTPPVASPQMPASPIAAPQSEAPKVDPTVLAVQVKVPAGTDAAPPPAPDTAAPSTPEAANAASALDARLAGDGQRTRLILDLSKPAEFRAFTLANPYRVILDLTDVTFTLSEARVQTRRGLVSAFRYGVLAPGKARMVLDVTEPVMIDKAFVLPPAEGQPARLVLDLVRTDAATFNTSVATAAEARGAPSAAVTPGPVAEGDVRPVIVLDPGHGGIDSGTSGASSYNEKNIVLDVALALRAELERTGRYRVVMTRSTDVFVPLGERVQIARANRAALFISIHADALARDDGNARGASVYTLSETASDADAAHLAEKENKADLIAGVDLSEESDEVAGILFDLAQRETRNFSATFARNMVGVLKTIGRVHKTPLKSAGFRVLKAHDVPSVLVELGYMSSREDLKLLTSDAWREKMAQAMAGAIDDFFAPRFAGVGPTGSIARPPAGK